MSTMATVDHSLAQPAWKPIIKQQTNTTRTSPVKFDADKHISYSPPQKIYKMTDIGYAEDTGVSPIAASEPFQLFTKDTIEQFRSEIFHPDVMTNCKYSGDLGVCMLRGYAQQYAPFVYDAWHNPETLKIISNLAGVELVPNMDFEIGHINISVKSEKQASAERESASKTSKLAEDSAPVVGWHKDSYPFVCVTMLSDCTNMIGGETAIRTANGKVMKIRGPTMGCAVVLQGRYITHQALRALGAQERITMVTSFRPRSAHLSDDSVLDTVRGVSNLSELYFGYGEYRLAMLEERIKFQLAKLRTSHAQGKRTDTAGLKQFLTDSTNFLEQTNEELVPDEEVVAGHQPTMDIPDTEVDAGPGKFDTLRAKL